MFTLLTVLNEGNYNVDHKKESTFVPVSIRSSADAEGPRDMPQICISHLNKVIIVAAITLVIYI